MLVCTHIAQRLANEHHQVLHIFSIRAVFTENPQRCSVHSATRTSTHTTFTVEPTRHVTIRQYIQHSFEVAYVRK